jgi:hypothetical protein
MTLAAFADLAEVVGALGVIASLLFVGVQMRQNTLQLQRAEKNATNIEAAAIRQAIFTDADFAELVSAWVRQSRPLSHVEIDRLTVFLWELGFQIIQFWDRAKSGLFTRQEFDRLTPLYAPYLTTPLGREWWQFARAVYRPDYVEALERVVPELTQAMPTSAEGAT